MDKMDFDVFDYATKHNLIAIQGDMVDEFVRIGKKAEAEFEEMMNAEDSILPFLTIEQTEQSKEDFIKAYVDYHFFEMQLGVSRGD